MANLLLHVAIHKSEIMPVERGWGVRGCGCYGCVLLGFRHPV